MAMTRRSGNDRRRPRPLLAALLALCMLLGACQTEDQPDEGLPRRTPMSSPTGSGNDVIVLIGTSSGDNSWRGDGAFRGADLGVSHLNRTRVEGDPIVELVTLDDGGDIDEAVRLIEEQASEPRTIGIVFAGPATALARTEAALEQGQVPAMLCFGDLHGAGLLSKHVFQLSPSYVWEANRIARYVVRDRRYRTVGGLVRDSLSGRVARRALREAFRRFDVPAPRFESYSDVAGIDDALRRLKQRRVEAIVVESSPSGGLTTVERLAEMDALYRRTATARIASAATRNRRRANDSSWRPQLLGFDGLLTQIPDDLEVPEGTIAAGSYSRGAHYLPVPGLKRFRDAYVDWWGGRPLNWEQRSYEAVRLIGWAARNTDEGDDPAETLETLRGERLGGLDVTFGPRDHASVDASAVGLWVVPRRGAAPESARLPDGMPWVPLARGFSTDGRRTNMSPRDWPFLFRGDPSPRGPAPRLRRSRFGVSTGSQDPVH